MDVAAVLRTWLAAEPSVVLAVVFGSRARGRARPGSDLDVGIAWAPDTGRAERNRVLDRIECALSATADAIDLDEAPSLLRMEIARTGTLVSARSPGAWERFQARAMLDWWDFAPLARRMHEGARARIEGALRGPR